jgi:hypothetical protein
MKEKRPIDLLRNSGASMEIGTPDDDSPVKEMAVIGGRLYVIKERGIYEIKMADNIDPERTNPSIPNTQQRVLPFGASDELVARVLLTAKGLFKQAYLGSSFDHEEALVQTLEALMDLVAMRDIRVRLEQDQERAKATLAEKGRALLVPSIGDVEARCEAFIQKADHAVAALLNIAKLFYTDSLSKGWFEGLAKLIEQRYGKDVPFSQFARDAARFFKFVRNTRHCVEHKKPTQRLLVSDFALTAKGEIALPTIEVIHAETANPAMLVTAFMAQLTDGIVGTFDLTIAFLCGHNMQNSLAARFGIHVSEIPEAQRHNKNVRYGYGSYDGERFIPAS